MVTAEWWERPEGVSDVQLRGTALSQGFSESQGEEHNTRLLKIFFYDSKSAHLLFFPPFWVHIIVTLQAFRDQKWSKI